MPDEWRKDTLAIYNNKGYIQNYQNYRGIDESYNEIARK